MAASAVPEQIQGRNPHYVNHEEDLERAERTLRAGLGNQVFVLSGSPGVGKTATAIELACRVARDYPDGSLRATLSVGAEQAGAEREVLRDWLRALGVEPSRLPERLEALQAEFQHRTAGRRLRLLLDGVFTPAQVRTLLPGDGGSLVIVTEGRPMTNLKVGARTTFIELSPLTDVAARELLARLAGAERVAAEESAVAEAVALCGRLPIALCVVGAMVSRSRVRSFAGVVERLRDENRRLAVLSRGEDLSVAAAFTAAYRLLSDSAQLCYRALGVPPATGEIGVDALAAVLQLPGHDVEDAVGELLDARLVDPIGDDESRLVVRELVRLHAGQVDERRAAERDADTDRLLDFYYQRTIDADVVIAPGRPWRGMYFPDLAASPKGPFADAQDARAWLRTERVNVRAALDLAADGGQDERVVAWCVLLWPFCEKEKLVGELLVTHETGLASAARLGRRDLEALLLVQLSFAHTWQGEPERARADLERAITLATDVGDTPLAATATEALGLAELAIGRRDAARKLLRCNLDLAQAIGDARRIALARLHLAKVEEPATALTLLTEADSGFAQVGGDESENRAKVRLWRGRALLELAAWDQARVALTASLEVMSARQRTFDVAEAHLALAELAEATADPVTALEHYRQAELCFRAIGLNDRAEQIPARITRLS